MKCDRAVSRHVGQAYKVSGAQTNVRNPAVPDSYRTSGSGRSDPLRGDGVTAGPDDELGYSLCVTPRHAAAAADDMRCLLNAGERARRHDPPGSLGDCPLVLLRHGVPFPPMAAAMEVGWAESQERLARLSTNSEIVVARRVVT